MIVLLLSAALAADVYVNGVKADILPDITLAGVTVRLDSAGNVWIDAPAYQVKPTLVPPPAADAWAAPAARPVSTPTYGAVTGATAAPAAVPTSTWWLVTEDAGSAGQTLDVYVNEQLVRRVASGEPQLILDLAGWLRPGVNTVRVLARPPVGTPLGALNLYLGQGVNVGGTVRIPSPAVRYTRTAADGLAGSVREYTLTVP